MKKLNGEPEPVEAARLEVLHRAINPSSGAKVVQVGQKIPDFVLNDQNGNQFVSRSSREK